MKTLARRRQKTFFSVEQAAAIKMMIFIQTYLFCLLLLLMTYKLNWRLCVVTLKQPIFISIESARVILLELFCGQTNVLSEQKLRLIYCSKWWTWEHKGRSDNFLIKLNECVKNKLFWKFEEVFGRIFDRNIWDVGHLFIAD